MFYISKVLLLEALKANRCDYVRVLLDQGVNFDPKNLPELYEQVNIIPETICHLFVPLHLF